MFFSRRIKKLLDENIRLENLLEKVKLKYRVGDIVQEKYGYSRTRDGYYSNIENLQNYHSKWKNSFFELHQDIAETYTEGNLSAREFKNLRNKRRYNDFNKHKENTYTPYVVHCYAISPSEKNGPILCLEDPFGFITSRPLSWISYDTAKTWVNQM